MESNEVEDVSLGFLYQYLDTAEIGLDGIVTGIESVSEVIHEKIRRYEADPRTTEEELEALYVLRKKCAEVQLRIERAT